MELWDILSEDGTPTGKTVERGSQFSVGEYHLVVHIWPVAPSGAVLIQRRSRNKKLMPGEWAATGGAAITGESSYLAAKRELYEELGIDADNLILLKRIKKHNSLVDVYGLKCKYNTADLKLQKSEVADAKWVSLETLYKMIDTGEYHNYGKEYFNIVADFSNACKGESNELVSRR